MDAVVSIRPSDFVEGGVVPVDKELIWKECRFANFDYTKKDGTVVASTIAGRITYVDRDGTEYVTHYSAGDPARFQPSKDGKKLVAVGAAQALSKSSNFYILLSNLISAGFPENRVPADGDISFLDGLETFNIGIPEPKRSGLVSSAPPVEGARERVISVPQRIIKLPWEKKGAKTAAPAKGAKVAAAEAAEEDSSADALAVVAGLLESAESVTRQQVATKAIRDKKQAVAKYVYTPEFQAALLGGGYSIDGENITKV